MRWKVHTLPSAHHWCPALRKWGGAETVAQKREEAQGLGRVPIAAEWEVFMYDLQLHKGELPAEVLVPLVCPR
ncbi:hypothetical protein NDU88_000013 [Pleurodeles waltl]|uniref:Uncharacterized protein n=1 Tax=Pleurodeles waltl TaxID=8319 RepID=A0AAV7NBH6_PLEWA|nr:hypothetical protein NDU88_000013 [Pleurodeles waltl]